jgi:transcriptional regulator with XRE-family HTH domain
MESATTLHPLIERFRTAVSQLDLLTFEEIAGEIGVSARTVTNWVNTETQPQKRHRKLLAVWLDQHEGAQT